MSISLEALAMMGVDYVKDGISVEEYEKYEEQVPPYLLVDDEEDENIHKENIYTKKLCEYSFCYQEFHRCEKDEGEKKKLLLIRNNIFREFLKTKDVAIF
ncbi:hypothetical protein H5410_054770 [Solanum commersonii]|uniref:Uncharacterized protein n=1 Tax=Solanum commersonii TaxID=4109 RepID=A0A9J5WHD0_SOLCO|nr:hypothetical protein H5410_054770 [Solanum commersonii]